MASYGMNDVKNGMKIIVNNEPCDHRHRVRQARPGQAFTRVRYRNIKSGRVVELTRRPPIA